MRVFLSIIVIFSVELFFSTLGILGIKYSGIENSNLYLVYNIFLFVYTTSLFFNDLIFKKNKLNVYQIFLILVPLIFTISFLFSYINNNINSIGFDRYIFFIVWAVPSILTGMYISKNNKSEAFFRYLDVVMLIIGVSSAFYFINVIQTGSRETIDGSTYQTISYNAALSYGINLYLLLNGKLYKRFNFTHSIFYKIFSIILLSIQIFTVLISGGRGGFVLLLVYTLLNTIFIYNNKSTINLFKRNKSLNVFFGIVIFVSLLFLFLNELNNISIFQVSVNRVFEYISIDGINWSATSTRNIIYNNVIELIYESPITGYGIFGMWSVSVLPHNLILEILMQGGFIYLFIFLLIGLFTIIKLHNLIKINNNNRFFLLLFIYPLILLMFSGSYLNNSMFWFIFAYFFSANLWIRS